MITFYWQIRLFSCRVSHLTRVVQQLARIPGLEVELPILQIFWHPLSSTPSTVIRLDSAVIHPEDLKDKSKWNSFRFRIRDARIAVDEQSVQPARIFTCTKESRDAWCQAVSTALLVYEKEKAQARKKSSYLSSSARRWRSSSWWATGDAHPSTVRQMPRFHELSTSRPTSPPRHLPRHEPSLIGEGLLPICFAEIFPLFLESSESEEETLSVVSTHRSQ